MMTLADGGVLASAHFLGYWLGAVFAAKLTYSPKATLRVSLIAIGICTLGMGLTNNFIIWMFLRWLSGVCSAFALVLVSNFYIKYLAKVGHPEKQGWVFSGVGAGIVIVGLGTMAIMVSQLGSSLSWQIFGVISLVAAAIISTQMGSEVPDAPPETQARKARRTPLVWSIIIAYGAMGIGYIIPATFLPIMARDIVQSPLLFGLGWPVFGAAAFLSTLFAARVQRHFSNRHLWALSQIIMAAGLLFPVIYPHISTIIIAGICVGGTFMIITMAGMKEAHRIAPSHDVMRHIAVMTTAFASGQMVGPVIASLIYNVTKSFSPTLVLTSVALVITALNLIGSRSDKEPFYR